MILIIGATGQVGSAVASELTAAGEKVRAVVRNPAKAEGLRQMGVQVVKGDATNPESIQAALDGVDQLFLTIPTDEAFRQTNKGVYDVAKNRVRRIVKISAVGATLDSPVRLLRSHGEADEDLRNSNIPYSLVQPVFFMQNYLQSAGTIAAQSIIVQPTGTGRMACIDVRDIAAFTAMVVRTEGHEGKTYPISSHDSLTGDEVAEKLSLAIGKKIAFVSPDPEEFKKVLLSFGMSEWYAAGILELDAWAAKGHGARTTDTFRALMGRDPISFSKFAEDHAQVFKEAAAGA